MDLFRYRTIPVILRQHNDINYCIRVYNEIYKAHLKLRDQPEKLILITNAEMQLIIQNGVHLMSKYAQEHLIPIPPIDLGEEIDLQATAGTIDLPLTQPSEDSDDDAKPRASETDGNDKQPDKFAFVV
jgi:hypothetical protein